MIGTWYGSTHTGQPVPMLLSGGQNSFGLNGVNGCEREKGLSE